MFAGSARVIVTRLLDGKKEKLSSVCMTNLTADIHLDRENAHPENLLAMKVF